MENTFLCPECHATHGEPADGRLGHLVVCTDCALATALAIPTVSLDAEAARVIPIAA